MTTLADLGVTQAKLRAYGHDGKFEALTGPQLQGVCCHLKALLDKKDGKYKRWSKSVAKEMRGIGVTQDQRSGEPTITYRKAKVVENISVSLEDFNRVEDELQELEGKYAVMEVRNKELECGRKSMVTELVEVGEVEISKEATDQLKDAELLKSQPGGFIKPAKIYGEPKIKPNKLVKPVAELAKMARETKDVMDQSTANNSISDQPKKRTRRSKEQIAKAFPKVNLSLSAGEIQEMTDKGPKTTSQLKDAKAEMAISKAYAEMKVEGGAEYTKEDGSKGIAEGYADPRGKFTEESKPKSLYSEKTLANMCDGLTPKPKRKRRTKAQIEEDKAK